MFEKDLLPMWVFDREALLFLAVNEAAVELYGYSQPEFLSMTLKDLCPPSEMPKLAGAPSQVGPKSKSLGYRKHRKAEVPSEVFGKLEGLRQGTVQVVEDLRKVPLPSGIVSQQSEGVRSYVNVPLIAGGDLTGVLHLRAGSLGSFSQEQVEIAREVADSLAVAIRQAHLNEQIESHAALLEQRVAERTVELSESNAKLRESEQRLVSIFGSAMDAIVVVDEAQRVFISNDAAERVFRCRQSEALGQRLETFLPVDFRRLLDSYILNAKSGAAPPCILGSFFAVDPDLASQLHRKFQ
jgi:PAS domain-containing protein